LKELAEAKWKGVGWDPNRKPKEMSNAQEIRFTLIKKTLGEIGGLKGKRVTSKKKKSGGKSEIRATTVTSDNRKVWGQRERLLCLLKETGGWGGYLKESN